MAKMILTAAFVTLNATDLSAYGTKAQLAVQVEEKDVTSWASAGWKEVLGGLKAGTLALAMNQDIAAAALDATMWPLLGAVVPFEVRLSNAARGPANPSYTGFVLVKEWVPLDGAPGDVAALSVSYPTSAAVTRLTA